MNIILYLYEFALLVYTGFRTYDFMAANLPSSIAQEMSLVFLGATEAGLVIWHILYRKQATTDVQSSTALALVVVDFLGSLGAGTADMILRQTFLTGYSIPPLLAKGLIYGMPLLVGLNVAGILIFQSHDAEEQVDREKKQTKFAIVRESLRQLRSQRQGIANSLKSDLFDQMRAEIVQEVRADFLAPAPLPVPPPHTEPIKLNIATTGNGYHVEASDPTLPPRQD